MGYVDVHLLASAALAERVALSGAKPRQYCPGPRRTVRPAKKGATSGWSSSRRSPSLESRGVRTATRQATLVPICTHLAFHSLLGGSRRTMHL